MFFDKLRAGTQGTTSKVILGLIIVSFALAGVGSYVNRPAPEIAAVVNGDEINLQSLETAYRNERARLENQLGAQFSQLLGDPQYVEQIRRSVLDQLIEQRLIDQKVQELGLRASDEQVRNAIRSLPEFQQDGVFDNDRYLQLLARSGLSAEQLRDSVRQDLSRQMLMNAVLGSSFTLEQEAGWLDRLSRQQRDGEYVRLPLAAFIDQVEPSDADIEAYYQQNPGQFQRPEQVRLNYLMLDASAFSVDDISEQEVLDYYQANQASYTQPEQRKVAHIMVNKGAEAEDKIKAIAARLQAGESFGELAKTESDDVFSGAKGGELEWMTPGTMDPAFDSAAFALAKAGDVSGIVESEFGLHLISLLEVRPAVTKPLDEVSADIARRLAQDKAADAFYAQEQKLAELAFEFPDSLDMAAQELGLEIVSTDYFSAQDAPTAISHPQLLQEAFGERLREQGGNSDLISLGQNKAAVIHVIDRRPAAVRELAEVRDQVRSRVAASQADQLTQEAAVALQQAWSEGQQEKLLAEHQLEPRRLSAVTRDDDELDPGLLNAFFAMASPSAEPSLTTVVLSNGDRAVIRLDKVTTPETASENMEQIRQGQSGLLADREYRSLLQSLKAGAEIEYRQLPQSDGF